MMKLRDLLVSDDELKARVVYLIKQRRERCIWLVKFSNLLFDLILKKHPTCKTKKIKAKVYTNREKSVSHIQTPSRS